MNPLADGVAHVSWRDGAMFLPAHSPYDRQVLVEHVADRLRSGSPVQVLLGGTRWMAHPPQGRSAPCRCCGSLRESTCHSSATHGEPVCLVCAFSERAERTLTRFQPLRAAS